MLDTLNIHILQKRKLKQFKLGKIKVFNLNFKVFNVYTKLYIMYTYICTYNM